MKVGDRVRMLTDAWEEGEDLPPGICASKGETLEVPKVGGGTWPIYVGHVFREKTAMFGVNEDEIELVEQKVK